MLVEIRKYILDGLKQADDILDKHRVDVIEDLTANVEAIRHIICDVIDWDISTYAPRRKT